MSSSLKTIWYDQVISITTSQDKTYLLVKRSCWEINILQTPARYHMGSCFLPNRCLTAICLCFLLCVFVSPGFWLCEWQPLSSHFLTVCECMCEWIFSFPSYPCVWCMQLPEIFFTCRFGVCSVELGWVIERES